MERFQDHGTYGAEFASHYLVRCPRCRALAQVTRARGLVCGSCAFVRAPGSDWFGESGVAARGWCPKCDRHFVHREPWRSGMRMRVLLTCECGATSEHNLKREQWTPYGQAYDPLFGCELWLRRDVRGEVLWAWNREHLVFIRDYVRASRRERTPNLNGSLASRLPGWIKLAKNRDDIVAALDAMEATLPTSA